jgi:hypothetical protein
MKMTKDIEIEVMEVHNLFWESYARRDIELRFSLCSETVTFIGSGLHERALNKTEYKNINKEGVKQFPDPFQIEFLWTNLSMINEVVACVESEVIWSQKINNEISKDLLRNTTLIKFEMNKWRVVHVHGSVPDYRLKDGDYMTNDQTIIRNKELERQVFERTQDLNKTLEELEQKNRELEIETTLEKVRTIAMGMREPADMLDVCKTISFQLQSLGVKEIRNVQTAIFYEQRGTYMNYEYYAKHDKTFITETVFTDNETHNEFATKMLKGKGETFITHIKGDEVKNWITYQKTTNVFIDKYLETASSLNYYWFSLGPVALGISTYIPLTEDEINLFKRFLKVFELAYQRYLDIEKAEAQAREAQIETALERVRSRTMGMQRSDELQDAAMLLFKQVEDLGLPVFGCGFNIWDDDRKAATAWMAGRDRLQPPFKTISSEDIFLRIFEAAVCGESLFVEEQAGEELKTHYEYMNSIAVFKEIVDKMAKAGQSFPTFQIMHCAYFPQGYLMFISYEPVSNAYDIFKRFAKVFEQTYTRFLDLQKAEAQAREAQIEAALERVRSKAMAMYNTNDLSKTVSTFFKELKSLNVLPWRCGVGQINEETKTTFLTTTSNTINGESFEVRGTLQQEGHPVLDGIFEHWKLQKEFYPVLQGNEIRKYYEIIRPQIAYPKYPLDAIQYGHFIFIREGFVFAWTENKLSEGELGIFRRFASVLSLTYRRYLDLKEAEEQNRIIQADNERKTKELEEARQLQLSMLPKELPKLPNLDIAVYMKTATEVGGDYYDFNVDDDSTLTAALGDATGHGMKAGTIVSMIKALFASGGSHLDIKTFFNQSSDTLKGIELGRLMMAFIMLKIKANKLAFANAGMPPLFIYRKKINEVEETILHGMPLGAMKNFPYEIKETELFSGDTILLLSDGLPELKNEKNEQYDYARVKEEFKSAAEKSPNEIVEYLKNSASQWMNGIEPDDDVTFVVIKIR